MPEKTFAPDNIPLDLSKRQFSLRGRSPTNTPSTSCLSPLYQRQDDRIWNAASHADDIPSQGFNLNSVSVPIQEAGSPSVKPGPNSSGHSSTASPSIASEKYSSTAPHALKGQRTGTPVASHVTKATATAQKCPDSDSRNEQKTAGTTNNLGPTLTSVGNSITRTTELTSENLGTLNVCAPLPPKKRFLSTSLGQSMSASNEFKSETGTQSLSPNSSALISPKVIPGAPINCCNGQKPSVWRPDPNVHQRCHKNCVVTQQCSYRCITESQYVIPDANAFTAGSKTFPICNQHTKKLSSGFFPGCVHRVSKTTTVQRFYWCRPKEWCHQFTTFIRAQEA